MDSNHDKVIQSRFVRLRKRARVFAALGKGPTRVTFHTGRSIQGYRAGQNGRISSMQQEQPRPYAVEGIAAIPGTKRGRRRPDYWRIEWSNAPWLNVASQTRNSS